MYTMRSVLLVCAVGVAVPLAAGAQTHAGHGAHAASLPVMEALMADVEQVEQKLVALVEAMPESSYGWRPGEGVRSVGEVVMHVAADNWFLPTFVGVDAPAATGITGEYPSVQAYEARQVDKAAAIAELRTSFDHLEQVMRGVTEADLAADVELFGMTMSGLRLWVLTTTHLHEHLGQMIAYARSNGVVPPWSQGS